MKHCYLFVHMGVVCLPLATDLHIDLPLRLIIDETDPLLCEYLPDIRQVFLREGSYCPPLFFYNILQCEETTVEPKEKPAKKSFGGHSSIF